MNKFGRFVDQWLLDNLTPLAVDSDCTFETWLDNTNYPKWRKDELIKIYDNLNLGNVFDIDNPVRHVKSFEKDETYPCYKYPRAINSRTDDFKVRVGPIFKLIEKELFKLHWFIKHISSVDRPSVIVEDLFQLGSKIIGTDYTSFEALFTKLLMENCEMKLYKYMSQNLPDTEWYDIVEEVLLGKNFCKFKYFNVLLKATRMSGEMCTSLGNGFTNLMVFLFVAKECGLKSLKGKVEGDDGLFTFYGDIPPVSYFEKLGLLIKLVEYDSITTASFCGIVSVEDSLINVTDPTVACLDFGWTSGKYANSGRRKLNKLLRAKSLSMAYQYPGCPILDALSKYGIRVTDGVNFQIPIEYDQYKRNRLLDNMKHPLPSKTVDHNTRLLVENLYGISVYSQLKIEEYLNSLNCIVPLDIRGMLNCNEDQLDYYQRYSVVDGVPFLSQPSQHK